MPKRADSGINETCKSAWCRKSYSADGFGTEVVGADDAVVIRLSMPTSKHTALLGQETVP